MRPQLAALEIAARTQTEVDSSTTRQSQADGERIAEELRLIVADAADHFFDHAGPTRWHRNGPQ
jgi:hypothetical protein